MCQESKWSPDRHQNVQGGVCALLMNVSFNKTAGAPLAMVKILQFFCFCKEFSGGNLNILRRVEETTFSISNFIQFFQGTGQA